MTRPRKARIVCAVPRHTRFGPLDYESESSIIEITVEEYEKQ